MCRFQPRNEQGCVIMLPQQWNIYIVTNLSMGIVHEVQKIHIKNSIKC